ncbi:hypothetical protein [Enhygromyxa salina]|uniref:hypothetical protein n=1 Tax=Enhygromyxa salina TaxID=215803 RepID=UPI000D02A72E|nr:hypothetical protein [Enhygromyxa salina]
MALLMEGDSNLDPASKLVGTERPWRGNEHVDLHERLLVDQVEATMIEDGVEGRRLVDVEVCFERTRERGRVGRAKRCDEVDVVGRPRLGVHRAGDRATDSSLDPELVELGAEAVDRL